MASKIDLFTYMKGLDDPESPYYVPRQDYETKPFKGLQNGLHVYKGHLLPSICRNAEIVKSMEVKPDDTFVVTFPKSGTHWVAEMCWLIQNNLEYEIARNEKFFTRVPFIEVGLSKSFLDQMQSPRVFYTHYQRELLPDDLNKKAKVVYVARNPKDVLVSLYYFYKKLPMESYMGTFNDLFDSFISGDIMHDAWWKHIDTFAQLENIHFMHFEDLLEDPINEARRLAKYLGKELTDEQIKELVDFCSFDKLKNNAAFKMTSAPSDILKSIMGAKEKGSQYDEKQEKDENPPKPKDHGFFRKGQIGDWKNHFTDEMSKKMDEVVAANLKYKKPFKYDYTK